MVAEIAIIGAGPSGLCSARHLHRLGLRPCIFEKTSVLGGLWHTSSCRTWDSMTPNLSRYTCVFSDFPWSEVGGTTSAFPSRKEMEKYFEAYSRKFLNEDMFKMSCTVTKVEQREDGKEGFKVSWKESSCATEEQQTQKNNVGNFDGVIVATGIFSDPAYPDNVDLTNFKGHHIHSSQYQNPKDFVGKTVAICGASFSALEIASDVARVAKRVVNILPNIPWVIPRYVPLQREEGADSSTAATPFVPVDLALYRRNQDAPKSEHVFRTAEDNQQSHAWIRNLLGTQKQSLLGFPSDETSPSFVSISDSYLTLLADKKIEVVKGKLTSVPDESGTSLSIDSGEQVVLDEIDALISCTGYHTNLNFLDSSILETLKYDPNEKFAPLVLCHDTYHPNIPNIGFVGMYRGPYLGVMELQARLLAEQLSGKLTIDGEYSREALHISEQIRNQNPRPQFPHGDYVGLMDSLSKLIGLVPKGEFGKKGSYVTPALYQADDDNLASKAMQDIEEEIQACENGKNMPEIVLNALVGRWKFQRTIKHYQISNSDTLEMPMSEQRVVGDVHFSFRDNDDPNNDKVNNNVLLYREDGKLLMQNKEYDVSREYEYSHNKESNTLEIHFIENGIKAHLFLSLLFHPTTSTTTATTTAMSTMTKQNVGTNVWEATSDHLCIKDLYKGTFRVEFDGIAPKSIRMEYRVKGPKKNYIACTDLQPSSLS